MSLLTQEYALQVVAQLLPRGAELAVRNEPVPHPAVLAADLDGDRIPEIVGVYRTPEGMQALVAKRSLQGWHVAAQVGGPGYGIAHLAAASIASAYPPTLLIGWQIGERWAQLDLFQYASGEYRHLTPYDVFYSRLAIEEIPSPRGRDGLCHLALWIHDREEAYQVELLRWHGNGLVRDPAAYPDYFASAVVPYYEHLLIEQPSSGLYRVCWEEARAKAGLSPARRQETADLTVLKAERARDAALEAAISSAYGMSRDDQGSYAYNRIDLNRDGVPETIVFLTGSPFCDKGGCSAAIFRSENGRYRFFSKLTSVQSPIIVSHTSTNGYRDLILSVSDSGIQEPVYKWLKFDGVKYPSNPSTEPNWPLTSRLEGTAILADDGSVFSGLPMSGGAISE